MARQNRPSVLVLGGGWSGLAAAWAACRRGASVTVLEAGTVWGGRARRVCWNGLNVDNGQHLLVGAYTATLDHLRSLSSTPAGDLPSGLKATPLSVIAPQRFQMTLPRWPAPLHLAWGLLSARGARWTEKIAAAQFMQRLKKQGFRLPGDQSVALWLNEWGQQGAIRTHVWEPLCLAALNTAPEQASAQIFANVLRDTLAGDRAATDYLLPQTDLSCLLPDPTVAALQSQGARTLLGQRVRRVFPRPKGGWIAQGKDCSWEADHLILATAPHHLAPLLPESPALDDLRAQLSAMHWEPIATVYQRYPPTVRLPAPFIALNDAPAQWLADRGQMGGPPGLLAHVLSAHGPWEKQDNEALSANLHHRAREWLGNTLPEQTPTDFLVIREQRATYSCSPKLHRPSHRTGLPGLWLAGDYLAGDYPATLEAAVRNGRAAAEAIF